MASTLSEVSSMKCFGGLQKVFTHESSVLKCTMTFGLYLPPVSTKVPLIWWLSGLTCTHENFMMKAGAQRYAAEHGIALIHPDTSPRGLGIEGEDDSWDFGTGAGFYLNATQDPWKENYQMYDYITVELPSLLRDSSELSSKIDAAKQSIMGHSMGGHGALTIYLKNIDKFRSVSGFSAICNPSQCPWGLKAFEGYLGKDGRDTSWKEYDATELVRNKVKEWSIKAEILLDQGTADQFLTQGQLLPDNFLAACAAKKIPVELRNHDGYDHSYFFIASFISDHIAHHAKYLKD